MSIVASWLDKKFVVDATTIKSINNFSLTKELDVEEGEVKDGKSPTNVKGFKPQDLTISHKVSKFAGSDPLQEFNEWGERAGKRAGFHIGGRRIGPPALILDKVEFNATVISNRGEFLEAEITLTFSEDVNFVAAPAAASEKYVGDTATAGERPGYNPQGIGASKSAYNVRPSASAAEAKM